MKIFIFLIGGFFLLFTEVVRAEQCKSIVDRCLPEETVIINEGLKTKNIFVSKRKVYRYLYSNNKVKDTVSRLELELSYKDLQKADRELLKESFGEKCGKEPCRECEEHLAYTKIDDKNFNQIQLNRINEIRCTPVMGSVSVEPMFVYSSAKVVSQVIATSSYGYHTGGSCHSRYVFNTYNLQTKRDISLKDVLKEPVDLKPEIVKYFREKLIPVYTKDVRSVEETTKKAEQTLENWPNTTELMDLDIYVEYGHVYINLNDWLFGCWGNSFFPMQVSDDLIDSTLLK